MFRNSSANFDDGASNYTLVTENSLSMTESDLPGPGRILGNVYSKLGLIAEHVLSLIAVRMGRSPRQTADKLRKLIQENSFRKPADLGKVQKVGKRLLKYLR